MNVGTHFLGCALASVVMVCGSLQATAAVVFFDNFEHYVVNTAGNNSVLNWNPPGASPWVVTDGTIDLIETGNYGLTASSGLDLYDGGNFFLDLDGTTNNAGTLFSINLDNLASVTAGGPGPFISLIAGQTYRLEFLMAGNQRSGSDTVNFGVALGQSLGTSTQLDTVILASNDPWEAYSYDFVYTAGYSIFFDNLGSNNIGALLDNVRISVVPVPPAAALVLLGMVGVGLRRKLVRTA